ncbi:DUF2971 domain-containing protein [Paenibacillus sp. FSL H7-0331]|uniref:DUF2971 domain-containing protein n=1 Tax=Paenibacillus sp. FSL H7-0331 TaxID=1920421 RepID=UPI00096DF408|nr:DUF2971 domain-containing protein [Paenibacillus sp. FSL H7-0331]OMF07392.1 hypothetical protein BK127_29165 [Paenibacillus sp. FSL H7-0331]
MERIFHYTTLEVLKLIISNKTIRFNSLSHMDDMMEGYSVDFGDLSKYYYVSSWSSNQEESIPLWYMYTNKMRGVRVEVDSHFLQMNKDKQGNIISTNSNLVAYPIQYGNKDSLLSPVKYSAVWQSAINGPRGYFNDNFVDIGLVKPVAWEFQKEVRFRFYGINKKYLINLGGSQFERFANSMFNNQPNDIDFADIEFDIHNFSNANFVLGPASTNKDYETLIELIRQIPNFCGKIQKSSLQIRFKEK